MGMVAGGDFFSELQDFCRERESASRCAPFEEICCRYEHLYEKYSASYEYLSRGVEDCAATRQCSVGGLSMHRGFYSPSHLDMVDSDFKRGTLLKKCTGSPRRSFEYLFDRFGRMICIYCFRNRNKEWGMSSAELFELTADGTLGFMYDLRNERRLVRISECGYSEADGTLTRYESAVFGAQGISEISIEIPCYEYGQLADFYWYRYNPQYRLLNQLRFVFSKNENGVFSEFTVEGYDGFRRMRTSPALLLSRQ